MAEIRKEIANKRLIEVTGNKIMVNLLSTY